MTQPQPREMSVKTTAGLVAVAVLVWGFVLGTHPKSVKWFSDQKARIVASWTPPPVKEVPKTPDWKPILDDAVDRINKLEAEQNQIKAEIIKGQAKAAADNLSLTKRVNDLIVQRDQAQQKADEIAGKLRESNVTLYKTTASLGRSQDDAARLAKDLEQVKTELTKVKACGQSDMTTALEDMVAISSDYEQVLNKVKQLEKDLATEKAKPPQVQYVAQPQQYMVPMVPQQYVYPTTGRRR